MSTELCIGVACYKGNDPELISKFGKRVVDLYNSEGDYVRDPEGNQVLVNSKEWIINTITHIKMNHPDELKGKDITTVGLLNDVVTIYVENLGHFYLSKENLLDVLKSVDYTCQKKRIRTHIKMK